MSAYNREEYEAALRAATLDLARNDLYFFTRYMFQKRRKYKWRHNWHHEAICTALMRVVSGECKRLIINIPPRYGKTEIAVINFIAWTLGLYPDAEFIHLSYSARLASNNSYQAKNLISTPEYGELFPHVLLASDSKARDDWRTTEGGVVYATGADGSITGYGAGKLRTGFGGAIIIDDPHKPKEAKDSEVLREKVLDNYGTTIQSRVNSPETPIILIMQRVHENDLSGYLINGGSGEEWEVVNIPAITVDENGTEAALWAEKHTLERLRAMEAADPYTFAGQYMQRPAPLGGGIWKDAWWKYYRLAARPVFRRIIQSWDTAFKAKQMNDYSACITIGETATGYYVLDIYKVKLETPELKKMIKSKAAEFRPHAIIIEDKASGQSLIQDLQRETMLPVIAFNPGMNDKVQRAHMVTPIAESGRVWLPEDHPQTANFVLSCGQFPNGQYDDDEDAFVQALLYLSQAQGMRKVAVSGY